MIVAIPKYTVVDQIHRVFTLHLDVKMDISGFIRKAVATLLTNYKEITIKIVQ